MTPRFSLPAVPSLGDKLLESTNRIRCDLWKMADEDGSDFPPSIDFELHGTIVADPAGLRTLRELLRVVSRREGGHHA
jgi:hypothetical protein